MFSKLEFFIAFKYLLSKRKEGFISITAMFSFVGIMIGVATLIIVMSVMNGFRFELVSKILGLNSHLTIYSKTGSIEDYDNVLLKIKNIENVKYANAIVESQAMISSKNKSTGAIVKGIKTQDLKAKTLVADNILAGNIENLSDKNSIIIGSILSQNLGAKVGDEIKVITAQTSETIIGSIPRVKTYKIEAVFESGMYEYDATTIFMNFEISQIHFQQKEKASSIEIFVNNENDLQKLKIDLARSLLNHEGLYFMDWQQSNSSFIDALKVESTVMFLILTLIILVAAFNIISSMIMLVKDKNKNIALLRTMGMTKFSIMRIFLICGSSIGFVGTFLGLVLGVLFSANINSIKQFLESLTNTNLFNPAIYFLSTLPSKIFISDVVAIVVMSLAISLLATIYPAYKASKLNPAEILRYE